MSVAGNKPMDMETESPQYNERDRIKQKLKGAGLQPGRGLQHAIKNMDIIPDDSVSIMDRPHVISADVVFGDNKSAISADSSVVGKVNPVMANFYQERERIRRKQAQRLLKQT